MKLVENPREPNDLTWEELNLFTKGTIAQAEYMIQQGYRKVPSAGRISGKVFECMFDRAMSIGQTAEVLHNWLLEEG